MRFRPGSVNQKAYILSRREQDVPRDLDERTEGRLFQLLKPEVLPGKSPLIVSVAKLSEEFEFDEDETESEIESEEILDEESLDEEDDNDINEESTKPYLAATSPFPGDPKLIKLWNKGL